MVLPFQKLRDRHYELIEHPNKELLNPASIDICIGNKLMIEVWSPLLPLWINRLLRHISFLLPKNTKPKFKEISLEYSEYSLQEPFYIYPGECILVPTLETLMVPPDLAMDIRLKSSRARELYDHALAFWFDPMWKGIGTMEIRNTSTFARLPIYKGLRMGQIIYHKLEEPVTASNGYKGKYQYAAGVEKSKDKT